MVLIFIGFFNASTLHLNQAGHPVGVQAGRLKRGLSSVFHYCSDFSQSCKMSQIWQIYLCKFSWTEMICVKKWHFANLIFRCSNIYILLFYPFFFSQWLLYGDNDIFHIFQVHFPLRFCPGKRFDWMEGEVRKTQVRSFWWQMMMTNDDDKGQWWWWNAVARDTRSRSLPLQWLLGHRSQGMGGHQTGLENPPKIPKGKTFFECPLETQQSFPIRRTLQVPPISTDWQWPLMWTSMTKTQKRFCSIWMASKGKFMVIWFTGWHIKPAFWGGENKGEDTEDEVKRPLPWCAQYAGCYRGWFANKTDPGTVLDFRWMSVKDWNWTREGRGCPSFTTRSLPTKPTPPSTCRWG